MTSKHPSLHADFKNFNIFICFAIEMNATDDHHYDNLVSWRKVNDFNVGPHIIVV